jgi:Arm DNA-binding domain
MGLGSFSVVSLADARKMAATYRRALAAGVDPIAHRKEMPVQTLEGRISKKALEFLERDMEPACYLYRHFHPNGDLLYVGISLQPIERHRKHLKEGVGAPWRNMIFRIVIEPFATREEALVAEETAIRDEFPKFNGTHNGRRHPTQEIARNVNQASQIAQNDRG